MRRFTGKELEQYDGGNGRPAYIAYMGRVYDVSESFLWQGGAHQALHRAGRDLTEALKHAPHGAEFIERFPEVGILIEPARE
jgi:predicted heme/steroid binding protein